MRPDQTGARRATLGAGLLAALCCLSLATTVGAQELKDSIVNDGSWAAKVQAPDGKTREAKVFIANFAGTWVDQAKPDGRKKSCAGTKFPLTVQASTESELTFTVWGSAVSPACPDLSINVSSVDKKTLEGTMVMSAPPTTPPSLG